MLMSTEKIGICSVDITLECRNVKKRSSQSKYASNVRAQQQIYIQQQKNAEYAKNCEMVNDYNELIDQIRSIHTECSDPIDWVALKDKPAPFNNINMGPYETQAKLDYDNAKPSLFGRLIPAVYNKRMQTFVKAIQEWKDKDQKMYTDWEEMRNLATQILKGDVDSYFYVISAMAPFDEILDFGSDFDIGTDVPELMEVEFHAKTVKVVPNHVLSLTQAGKLSSKLMTKICIMILLRIIYVVVS